LSLAVALVVIDDARNRPPIRACPAAPSRWSRSCFSVPPPLPALLFCVSPAPRLALRRLPRPCFSASPPLAALPFCASPAASFASRRLPRSSPLFSALPSGVQHWSSTALGPRPCSSLVPHNHSPSVLVLDDNLRVERTFLLHHRHWPPPQTVDRPPVSPWCKGKAASGLGNRARAGQGGGLARLGRHIQRRHGQGSWASGMNPWCALRSRGVVEGAAVGYERSCTDGVGVRRQGYQCCTKTWVPDRTIPQLFGFNSSSSHE